MLEELCMGDVGFGLALMHAWREGWIFCKLATESQLHRFLPDFIADDTYLTAMAMTEPEFGSDNGLSYTGADGHTAGPRTTAVLDGDEWVINGRKIFITNASIAKLIVVNAVTDPSVPWVDGLSYILVPAGTPGLECSPPDRELGARLRMGGVLTFRDCRVPRDNLLGPLHGARKLGMSAGNKAKEATKALGVGRAAYEIALDYARRRVQGGKRIIEHQLVGGTLADMAIELEMARTLIWRAAWAVDHDPELARGLEDMVKIGVTEIVMRVATRAIQVWGHAGALESNPIEKLVRDAAVMLLPPIGNSAARVHLSAWLDANVRTGLNGSAPDAAAIAALADRSVEG